MLCRVEMPNHEALYGRFYRWKLLHQKGGKFSLIGLPVLILIAAAGMLGLRIGLPVAAALAAIVAGYFGYALYLRPNALYRQKAGAALQTVVYMFTETGYTRSVRSEEGGLPDNTSGQYSALVRAVETTKDFYLFTGPTQAYLVDKEYFTKGTPQNLSAILKNALGDKFKTK